MSEQQGTGVIQSRSVHDILNETRPGRQALNELAGPLFVSLWTDVLNMVFEWFPHTPGDNSDNERSFQSIRHRVLRVGNDKKRKLTMILEDFAVAQLRTTKVERMDLHVTGPFALPDGVKMPPKNRR